MKVRSSLKTLKTRHRDCKLVRRKGRLYQPALQGAPGLSKSAKGPATMVGVGGLIISTPDTAI